MWKSHHRYIYAQEPNLGRAAHLLWSAASPWSAAGLAPHLWHFGDFMTRLEVVKREKVVVFHLFIWLGQSCAFPWQYHLVLPLLWTWWWHPLSCSLSSGSWFQPNGKTCQHSWCLEVWHFTKFSKTRGLTWWKYLLQRTPGCSMAFIALICSIYSKAKLQDHVVFYTVWDTLSIAAELTQAASVFGVNCLLFAN